MNADHDTSGSTDHDADRRYLTWLRTAPSPELRAHLATQARTYTPSWERKALERELCRRVEVPPAPLSFESFPCAHHAGKPGART